jgi:uncharacterized protein involved in exopolysaccharide biosynthesis
VLNDHSSQFEAADRTAIGQELRLAARALTSRFWLIAGTTLATTLLGIAYLWTAEVQYTSTSEILIDPRSKQLLERQIAPTGLGSSSLGPDTILLDSQIEVIRSSLVLDKVIEKNGLLQDAEYGSASTVSSQSVAGDIARWILRGPQSTTIPNEVPLDKALRKLNENLRVSRKNNTYVVAISVNSSDRFKAADVANSISAIYVDESNASANAVAVEASSALSERLQKLQKEAAGADRKVEEYRTKTGLTESSANALVEQQLKELTSILTNAKIATQEEEAKWREIEPVKPTDLRRLPSITKEISPQLSDLMAQLTAAQSREESVKAVYLPRHPLLKSAVKQRAVVERAISTEISGIKSRQRALFEAAVNKELEIEAKVTALETKSSELRMASLQLNELIAEATLRNEVLASFKNGARQAEEQIGLPASTVRIITRATPSSRPSSPKAMLLLAAACGMGIMLGVLLAWLMHVLNGTRTREPQPYVARWTD